MTWSQCRKCSPRRRFIHHALWYQTHFPISSSHTPLPYFTFSTHKTQPQPPSLRTRIHPIRHLRPHIHDRFYQILDHLRPRLLANRLDLVELGLRVLLGLLFGRFVA